MEYFSLLYKTVIINLTTVLILYKIVIIEFDDGSYAAFEIKIGANKIDEAANNLVRIKNSMIEKKVNPPKVLCVICGLSNAIYTRDDGVIVIPITALKD